MNPFNIDAVFCLCLDKRQELWKPLVEKTWEMGWKTIPFIVGDGRTMPGGMYDFIDHSQLPPHYPNSTNYETWWKRPNVYNAWKSHKKIMRMCLDRNYYSVMFLEDDVYFVENFAEKLKEIEEFFANIPSWNMIYLGSYTSRNNFEITEVNNVYRLLGGDCGGFHAVVMKKEILQKLDKFQAIGPFDWIANKYLHKSNECYVVYPSLINQISGYSYIEGHNLEKPKEC